ncbi:MAG: hypothetical protein ACOY3P_19120 [Planctomycetota bacterium]
MAQDIRGRPDPVLMALVDALRPYEVEHPEAEITAYRQNSVSVRVRIVDPAFEGTPTNEREDAIWQYFAKLPDETQNDLTMLLLLTPDEARQSYANMEFEDPVESML